MENRKYGGYKRRKRAMGIAVILLLSIFVLFGGREVWKAVIEEQAENIVSKGREKLPVFFSWAFRQYYPGGSAVEKERKDEEEEKRNQWLDWLWDSIPLYRQGNEKRENDLMAEGEDPAYRNYMDSRKIAMEYEAVMGWGKRDVSQDIQEDTEENTQEETEGEYIEKIQQTSVSGQNGGNGTIYSREQLADYDFMMSHFFSVHPSTTAGRDIMNAQSFLDKDLRMTASPDKPQILIYHTHSQETFADYSQENPDATVVGVGNYLTYLLKEKGYNVIHDTSAYDIQGGQLDRSKAYTYALEGITNILQENPSIQVVLDIHRDGVDEDNHMVSWINGKATAQIMFFLGMSRTPKEAIEYLPNPNLESNLAFSFQMQLKAAEYFPGLTRKIYLKGLRYNLHVRPCSSLIEVGAQNNTLEEAKNAMEPLAEVLDMVLQGK